MSRFYSIGNPATPLLVLAAIVSSNTGHARGVVDWNAITSKGDYNSNSRWRSGTGGRPRLCHGALRHDDTCGGYRSGDTR